MRLTDAQRRSLTEDGYLVVRGAVPRPQVDAAVRAINADIGQGIDPARIRNFQSLSFCPGLQRDPVIVGLYRDSAVMPIVEELIGPGRVRPIEDAQIALRFPTAAPKKPYGPHIDGLPDREGLNGVPPGTIFTFTGIACVLLSPLTGPDAGNFTVWRGSHRVHSAYLREHGLAALPQMPLATDCERVPITGEPGDVVIAHYLLGHTVSPNLSPHVRYACFFRLSTHGLEERREALVRDPWLDWEGLREPVRG